MARVSGETEMDPEEIRERRKISQRMFFIARAETPSRVSSSKIGRQARKIAGVPPPKPKEDPS